MNIKPIRTEADYEEALVFLEQLIDKNPKPESAEGDQLAILATLIEDYETIQYPQTLPTPVAAIKFRMEQANLKPADLIPYLGSRSRVSEILSGKRPLTLGMIRALEAGLGIPSSVLIQKLAPTDAKYHNWGDPLVKEMSARKYFAPDTFDGKNKESLLSRFFANHSLFSQQLAWRKTDSRISVRTDEYALLAWAEHVQHKADNIQPPVNYKDGVVVLEFLRDIAKLSADVNGPLLARQALLNVGIVIIIDRQLPKTNVDGVTILKDKQKPIIGLSLRFDRLDSFWFTLLHELAHISLHLNRSEDFIIFDELEGASDITRTADEKDADSLAQNAIIPEAIWDASPAKVIPSSLAAQSLADELGIHIAVIAGFIRHKHQNYYYLHKLVNNDNARVRHYFAEDMA